MSLFVDRDYSRTDPVTRRMARRSWTLWARGLRGQIAARGTPGQIAAREEAEPSPTTPLPRVLVTITVTLLLALVLGARGVVHAGMGMPEGPARAVTLAIGDAALRVAELTRLDWPWDQLATALGHPAQPATPPLLASGPTGPLDPTPSPRPAPIVVPRRPATTPAIVPSPRATPVAPSVTPVPPSATPPPSLTPRLPHRRPTATSAPARPTAHPVRKRPPHPVRKRPPHPSPRPPTPAPARPAPTSTSRRPTPTPAPRRPTPTRPAAGPTAPPAVLRRTRPTATTWQGGSAQPPQPIVVIAGPPGRALRRPAPGHPFRLLVTGDSLPGYLGPRLVDEAAKDGPVLGLVDIHNGTGLTTPTFVDWSVLAHQQVAADSPDAVIVWMGGNDFENMNLASGQWLPAGTPAWTREYQRRAEICMRIWTQQGRRRLYWLSMPPARNPSWASDDAQINIALQRAVARVPGATYVNILGPITDHGRYTDFVRDARGLPVLVREPDGVHVNIAGSAILAQDLLPVLRREWRPRWPA